MSLTPQIRAELKARLRERDGVTCHWCGRAMSFGGKWTADRYATLEHLIRQADGGLTNMENCVLACRKCNNERHAGEPVLRFKRVSGPYMTPRYRRLVRKIAREEARKILKEITKR